MPVIASYTIPLIINSDRTIDILIDLKKRVTDCGCATLKGINTWSLEEVKNAAMQLVGEGSAVCDFEAGVCCLESKDLDSFISKMKLLRGK